MSLTFQLFGATALACAGLMIAKGVPLIMQWVRQRSSANRPWAKITVDSGAVSAAMTDQYQRVTSWELKVEYSYTVEGHSYSGTYRSWFDTEAQAKSFLKSVQKLPPPARYLPGKPDKSVLEPYRDAALAFER